jgi:uncharacterized protein (TIGR02145 family)
VFSLKCILALYLGATLCAAQTINIRGTVKDSAGDGIPGATVKLEKADLSTTTGADGSFTLTNGSPALRSAENVLLLATSPIRLQNNTLEISLSENTIVSVSVHDVAGRQLFNSRTMYCCGTHSIPTPAHASGIHLYRVTIGQSTSSFKSFSWGTFSNQSKVIMSNNAGALLARQAKPSAIFSDIIAVMKEGHLHYRVSIKTSDTIGIAVTMIPNAGNVTDADGNVYQSVRLGKQVWTVENLKTTKYNDTTAIMYVPDTSVWNKNFLTTIEAYCFFESSTANGAKYGALYNWHAVKTGKLAPVGWHVPTNAEWDTLQNYLIANGYNWDGTTTGNKIAKAMASKTDWIECALVGTIGNDVSANNSSGFSALPGGSRAHDGFFLRQSFIGSWWSATENVGTAMDTWYRDLYYGSENLGSYGNYGSTNSKSCGMSVRLIRDN